MSPKSDYIAKITQLNWDDLSALWQAIRRGDTPGWEAGRAFEYLVLRAFQLEGAEVAWPYRVELENKIVEEIDGVIYSDGLAFLVESKDEAERVNFEPIAKLRIQLLRRPPTTLGLLFSRSGFTDPAAILARTFAPQSVLLWDGDEISFALEKRYFRQGLRAKYRYCVQYGLPDYNITSEETE